MLPAKSSTANLSATKNFSSNCGQRPNPSNSPYRTFNPPNQLTHQYQSKDHRIMSVARFTLLQLWRDEFRGYSAAKFQQDLLAGITVAAVALPLALAFGIASGA